MVKRYKLVYNNNSYDIFPTCNANDEVQALAYFSSWLRKYENNYWAKIYTLVNLSDMTQKKLNYSDIYLTARKYFNKLMENLK